MQNHEDSDSDTEAGENAAQGTWPFETSHRELVFIDLKCTFPSMRLSDQIRPAYS